MKKVLIFTLTLVMIISSCNFVYAAGRTEIIPFDNLEGLTSFGDTADEVGLSEAGVSWYDWGTDKSAETVKMGKGTSIKLISTTTANDDIVTSPGKTIGNATTSVIGFSARFDDFNAIRYLQLQGYDSVNKAKRPQYPGTAVEFTLSGMANLAGATSGIPLETGVWYDFVLEIQHSDLSARLTVTDGITKQVSEGQITALLTNGAVQFDIWNRMDFYAAGVTASGATQAVAYIDNVYFNTVDYGITNTRKATQSFDSFAGITHPTDNDGTLKEGWYLWDRDAENGTVSSQSFSNSKYGTALKFVGDGSLGTNLVSNIVSGFQGTDTAVILDYDFRQVKGGMTTRLRGKNSSGSNVYHPLIDVLDTGAVYGYSTQFCAIEKEQWYHMNIQIDFANNKFTATVTKDGILVGTTTSYEETDKVFPMQGITTAGWLSYYINTTKSSGGFEFDIDNVAVSTPGVDTSAVVHGKIPANSKTVEIRFNENIDASKLGEATFLVNGEAGKVSASVVGGNTVKLTFAQKLEDDSMYFIEAKNIVGKSGYIFNQACPYYTPAIANAFKSIDYKINGSIVSAPADGALTVAPAVSNDGAAKTVKLLVAVYDEDDCLKAVEVVPCVFTDGEASKAVNEINMGTISATDKVKTFLWDNALSSPLTPADEL